MSAKKCGFKADFLSENVDRDITRALTLVSKEDKEELANFLRKTIEDRNKTTFEYKPPRVIEYRTPSGEIKRDVSGPLVEAITPEFAEIKKDPLKFKDEIESFSSGCFKSPKDFLKMTIRWGVGFSVDLNRDQVEKSSFLKARKTLVEALLKPYERQILKNEKWI